MTAPFDLDTAIAYGAGPARFLAAIAAMSVRDGASRFELGPDPRPGVIGAELSYTRSGKRYDLVPPTHASLPSMMRCFRRVAGGDGGACMFRLGGELFVVQVRIEHANPGDRAMFDLPVLPALARVAGSLLTAHLDANGMMEFLHDEFD